MLKIPAFLDFLLFCWYKSNLNHSLVVVTVLLRFAQSENDIPEK